MKVLDLQCDRHHVFEGWFASEEDFVDQCARGLVECPVCSDASITKKLSAPRLNLGHGRADPVGLPTAGPPPGRAQALTAAAVPGAESQAAWMALAHQILAQTDDVGDQFAEEARRIHYGEAKERAIRGRASAEQTEALLDEGIAVMPLLLPESLKGPLQ